MMRTADVICGKKGVPNFESADGTLRALGLYEAYVARKLQGMARQLLNPPE